MKRSLPVLLWIVWTGSTFAFQAEAPPTDEQLLRTAGLVPDGPTLVSFFRTRTQLSVDPATLAPLFARLDAKDPGEREKATGAIVSFGSLAVPQLRQMTRDPDQPGLVAGAQRCLRHIEGSNGTALPMAAARVLARLRIPEAMEVLLAYLPFADEENVLEEVKSAIASLASPQGKLDAALLKALDDPSPLRRTVAAEVIATSGGEEGRAAARRLLKDSRPVVRLRAAQVLATLKDTEAVGMLITLLTDLPLNLARNAEESLMSLAADQAPKVPLGTDDASRKKCREAWLSWWRSTETATPLQEFKKRTLVDQDRAKIQAQIRRLGDESFAVRELAQTAILAFGPAAAPLLRQVGPGEDEELRKRARRCLEMIEKEKGTGQLASQARLVSLRKPAGAAEVLLGFVPFADEDSILEEVRNALASVAIREGKVDPVLITALTDAVPMRRAAAGEALALAGAAEHFPAIRKLLADAERDVRLRVGLALAMARDRAAVPVLIDLLGDLPFEQGTQAELYLRSLAGDSAPGLFLSADPTVRQKVREAWGGWWKESSAIVDMTRPTRGPRQLGYTVVVSSDYNRVFEVGMDGKVRWTMEGLQYPRDAQVLPGDRVLVAEQGMNRVSEWTQKREVVWQKQLNAPPVSCARLSNGNTFIAMNNGLVEVDRSGKEVFTYNRPSWDIMAGHRLPDGQTVILTNGGQIIRLDASGKEGKTFNAGGQNPWSIELLPNGRILVPLPGLSKVVEYDADGKIAWEAAVQAPYSASRLPNGNTLVASYNTLKVMELNRAGRVVWEYKSSNTDRPYRARRR